MNVGIRELRNGLSRHIDRVRAGETITVTDHGRPVARLVPVGGESTLERLFAQGLAQAADTPRRAAREPIDIGDATVSDLVADQRG